MTNTFMQLRHILDQTMNLQGRALQFSLDTKLRGSLPQLDSLAVVMLIAALEEQFSIEFPEEALLGTTFDTVGTLVECVERLRNSEFDVRGK